MEIMCVGLLAGIISEFSNEKYRIDSVTAVAHFWEKQITMATCTAQLRFSCWLSTGSVQLSIKFPALFCNAQYK